MQVKIKVQPTGLLNGAEWPQVGGSVEVPDVVAADLIASGHAEVVAKKEADKAEKRPASKRGVETRKAE